MPIPRKIKRYGWRPDLPDHRDQLFPLPARPVPQSIDLRPDMPLPAFDQEQVGSCVWNADGGAIIWVMAKSGLPIVMPSRLYGYFWTRYLEGGLAQTREDSGCTIRDSFRAANAFGECSEDLYPYDIEKYAQQPGPDVVAAARQHRPLKYRRLSQSKNALTQVLASGWPIIFGFSVYDNFESEQVAQTGILPMPGPSESLLGGHAVLAVGYDLAMNIDGSGSSPGSADAGAVLVRNSWGTGWGQDGHFWMPFRYITNRQLASDFWVLQAIE